MGNAIISRRGAKKAKENNGRYWEKIFDYGATMPVNYRGLYVASTPNLGAIYSTDGVNWQSSNLPNVKFNKVGYGDGLWVAVCYNNGGFFYSTNGKTWSQSNITNKSGTNLSYANGKWVATQVDGSTYTMVYSTNGKTWSASNLSGNTLDGLWYYKGVWAVTTTYITYDYKYYYSTNGFTWQGVSSLSGSIHDILCANGLWVLCGQENGIQYSEDGINWIKSNKTNLSAPYLYHLNYANELWYCGGGGGYWYSTDGKYWQDASMLVTDLKYENGVWISSSSGSLYYSGNGIDWTRIDEIAGTRIENIAYANGMWITATEVIGGISKYEPGVWYSIDGQNWYKADYPFEGEGSYISFGPSAIKNINGIWYLYDTYNGVYYSTFKK